ncbi:arginyltransferase [Polynucleobacter kasalickyi]|uniref:Aspartate/glutamate leucyltransferase n=1 Tax=Polynucleobacter kasalickyi TaxID=1938817 RepID=A0A1W2B2F8_9BURK|nr:arginyltransferase [Polynucleobacter kasalickyi]SMC66970.1 arginine-tRNA-protein transferase [Polynucleobacter kasalickyi]
MTNLHDFPIKSLQFYATSPYACSYLPNLEARSQVVTPAQFITTEVYNNLILAGFRRSGHFTYRPYCDHCKACIASRVRVDQFKATRSQKRAFHKHQHLTAHILPLQFVAEHFQLYQQYLATRHTPMDDQTPPTSTSDEEEQYRQFLIQSHIDSYLVEFREGSTLRMVSVIDQVKDGISSVYTFFDTTLAHSSFGTYGILWQIEYAKKLKLPYVYLGYYIEQSKKMSYKMQYQPLEGLIDNQWTVLAHQLA